MCNTLWCLTVYTKELIVNHFIFNDALALLLLYYILLFKLKSSPSRCKFEINIIIINLTSISLRIRHNSTVLSDRTRTILLVQIEQRLLQANDRMVHDVREEHKRERDSREIHTCLRATLARRAALQLFNGHQNRHRQLKNEFVRQIGKLFFVGS
jgi:hypothetical protein